MIKGKLRINWFSADELRNLDDSLPVSDFTILEPFYDVCEETMEEEGFVLWDDDIEFVEEIVSNGFHEMRYNCAVVRGTKRKNKFIIKELGIAYYYIKNSIMDDISKLAYAYDHLSVFKAGGKPEEDSLKAKKYLKDIIEKMKSGKKKNI